MKIQFGRHFYGVAVIAYGVVALVGHRVDSLGSISHLAITVYVVGIAELAGGLAIQWRRTAGIGALVISAVFSLFSIYWIPYIVGKPLVFGYWGNFFEAFSIVLGGIFIFASDIRSDPGKAAKITLAAYLCFGICVVSFALYQLFYLTYTAELVPKWIPPGQLFWAVATTVAFGLAAVSLLSGRSALLASVLLTLMIMTFGLLVWVPAVFTAANNLADWLELSETLAIGGVSWIVVDFLSQSKMRPLGWSFFRLPVRREEK